MVNWSNLKIRVWVLEVTEGFVFLAMLFSYGKKCFVRIKGSIN